MLSNLIKIIRKISKNNLYIFVFILVLIFFISINFTANAQQLVSPTNLKITWIDILREEGIKQSVTALVGLIAGIFGSAGFQKFLIEKKLEEYKSSLLTQVEEKKNELNKVSNIEIENLRAELQHDLQNRSQNLQFELDSQKTIIDNNLSIIRENHLAFHRYKLELYRSLAEPLLDFVNEIIFHQALGDETTINQSILYEFNKKRLKNHAELVMFAPQNVIDAYDEAIDYILKYINGEEFNWKEFRKYALQVLNRMRNDIGINEGDIKYNGYM
ncbi:hypothetical protein [Nostoc sp. CALU 1950]|uniref:hypothetical protein n=1 Tax=Nostoc sp. CALU 1950 TaxID=3104321 RepID=UPI003EBC3443